MRFQLGTESPLTHQADLLALVFFDDAPSETPLFVTLDKALGGALAPIALAEQWKGKKKQALSLYTLGKLPAGRLVLVGAGPRKDFSAADLRGVVAQVCKIASAAGSKRVAVVAPQHEAAPPDRAAHFVAEGALLTAYRFNKYLAEDKRKPSPIEEVNLLFDPQAVDGPSLEALARVVARAERVAAGVCLARDLVNEPAEVATPSHLARVATELAQRSGLEVKVFDRAGCEELKMGMFLGVARGTDEEPKLIHLVYRPVGGAARRKIAIVGKGVTFDSGGLSLKPSASMEDMKTDMAGAAAVIATMGVLGEIGCPYEVHAVAACTENMLSQKSYKLGDVLVAKNGKTIEINNTDAEGRLTLGDAFTYVIEAAKPDELIDVATLTGACIVALGPHTAGVMGNDQALVDRVVGAARAAGEDVWPLPLPERLRDQLKSDVADMRNTGDRMGGALTAGIFLREFVGETPWVHIDIAGPSAATKEFGHISVGGTGFAVATLVEYLVPRV